MTRPSWRFVAELAAVLAALLIPSVLVTRFVALPWTVLGPSMEPTLHPGDRVIVDLWTYGRRAPRSGEIALLLGPGDVAIVKRVAARVQAGPGAESFLVLGDHPETSEDSRAFGPVPRERFRGRVVWRYWPLSRFGPIHGGTMSGG